MRTIITIGCLLIPIIFAFAIMCACVTAKQADEQAYGKFNDDSRK